MTLFTTVQWQKRLGCENCFLVWFRVQDYRARTEEIRFRVVLLLAGITLTRHIRHPVSAMNKIDYISCMFFFCPVRGLVEKINNNLDCFQWVINHVSL